MTPVRLEPAAPRSRVKHSSTEPLRSLLWQVKIQMKCRMKWHFIEVCTTCLLKAKSIFGEKKNNMFFEIIACDPSYICTIRVCTGHNGIKPVTSMGGSRKFCVCVCGGGPIAYQGDLYLRTKPCPPSPHSGTTGGIHEQTRGPEGPEALTSVLISLIILKQVKVNYSL